MAVLSTTYHHIRRSPYQTIAAILIMMVTFLSISVFTFLIIGSSKVIMYFESQPQVQAFFKDDANPQSIDTLKTQLQATGKIAQLSFVSKQDAFQLYKQQNKNDPLLLDLVTADILPSSFKISTSKIEDLPDISTMLKNSPIVQEVIFQKDVISSLITWTNAIRSIGIVLIVILSIISILTMTTIIGIKISQKKEEIEIMRLLGATKFYISWPFVMEGMFYGIVGALLGCGIATGALLFETPFLATFLHGMQIVPVPPIFLLELFGGEFIFAILLGMFSSSLAVSRYMK